MKKMTLLGLVAALTLGFASVAGAAELKVKGDFEAHAEWTDNTNFLDADDNSDGESEDDFLVMQRMRVRFDFVQSENLRAVLHLEIGDTFWGRDNYGNGNGTYQVGKGTGGGISADGVAVEVKNAYLDFNIPETVVNMKVGIQEFAFPGTVFGNAVHANDSAGVLISAPINDMVSVAFAWTRPVDVTAGGTDGANSRYDETDILLLAVPFTPEGMKITPWGSMAIVGKDSVIDGTDGDGNSLLRGVTGLWNLDDNGIVNGLRDALDDSSTAWWAGLAFELNMFDPILVAFDFAYGKWSSDLDNVGGGWDEVSQAGWMVDLSLKYKGLDFGTPEIFFAYASGNDESAIDDGKFGTLPWVGDSVIEGWTIPGSFFLGGTAFSSSGNGEGADKDINIQGHWVLGAALRDVSFIEKLSHTLIIAYIRGTNDEEFITKGIANGLITVGSSIGGQMSTKDSVWEIDFNHEYKVYEQLSAILELGWLHANYDEDTWSNLTNSQGNRVDVDEIKDAWRVQLGLKYQF